MGRIAALVGAQGVKRGTKCHVGTAIANYTKAEQAEWREAFADKSITQSQLMRAFRADGHAVGLNSIGRHARGECNCG